VFANPSDVGDPVAVAVTGEEDVVGDIVCVEMLERAVAVSEVGLFKLNYHIISYQFVTGERAGIGRGH